MSERSKYSLNGVYRCENFAQHVRNENFPRFLIGPVLNLGGWYIEFRMSEETDGTWVHPIISNESHPNIRIRAYFNIIKKDESSAFEREIKHVYLKPGYGCIGWYMNIDELLDEKNGYLDEGALTVEYGLQVESVEGDDGIWKFNLHDNFFYWKTRGVYMLEFNFGFGFVVFSHKQIVKLHSNKIKTSSHCELLLTFFDSNAIYMCVQITHGVRLQIDAYKSRNVAKAASHYGFFNTVRYCERQLIEMDESTELEANDFQFAVDYDLRCYLVHLLKLVKTKKQLIKILRRLNPEEMSSESMKAIVAKIFSLCIRLIKLNEKGRTWVYPFISHYDQPNLQIRAYFNIIKKDGSSVFEREIDHLYMNPSYGCLGWYMDIDELLDEKNGYLDEGALTVEYGLQVESVEGDDGIWKFNLRDKFFEWQVEDYMFSFIIRQGGSVFGHKQLIKMHSNTIAADKNSVPVPNFFYTAELAKCIQITHGVRLQMDAIDYQIVALIAFHFGFSNTVRYCEEHLIAMEPKKRFELAVKCNMRRYMVNLLEHIETKAELIKILRRLNLKNMPSESMKVFVAKIFSL